MDMDHLRPVALGGGDGLGNLAPAHARCNRRKQDLAEHRATEQLDLSPDMRGTATLSTVDMAEVAARWLGRKLERGDVLLGPLPTELWGVFRRLHVEVTAPQVVGVFVGAQKEIGAHTFLGDDGLFYLRS